MRELQDDRIDEEISRLLDTAAERMPGPGYSRARIDAELRARRLRRQRARAVTVTAVVALGVSVAATLALGGVGVGVVVPAAWPTGQPVPTGFPTSTSTATITPSDPRFDFFTGATTYRQLAVAGPSDEQLGMLQDARAKLEAQCLAAQGIVVHWPSAAEGRAEAAAELDVRAAADRRRARAFGDPAYAEQHGYGIDWQEWQEVVLAGSHGGVPAPELPAGMTDEEYTLIDAGPNDEYMSADSLFPGPSVPGSGCIYESTQALYGDYSQWVRSEEWQMNVLRNLEGLASAYDPEMFAATRNWSDCMAARGWRGLGSRDDAFSVAWDAWTSGKPDAADIERTVAVDDADCVVATGYLGTWRETQAKVVAQVVSDPDVVAYGALIEAALPRAEQVLAQR